MFDSNNYSITQLSLVICTYNGRKLMKKGVLARGNFFYTESKTIRK